MIDSSEKVRRFGYDGKHKGTVLLYYNYNEVVIKGVKVDFVPPSPRIKMSEMAKTNTPNAIIAALGVFHLHGLFDERL